MRHERRSMQKSAPEFRAPTTRTELKNSRDHRSEIVAMTFRRSRTGRLVHIESEMLPAYARDESELSLRWRPEHHPRRSSNERRRPLIVKYRARWRPAVGRPLHLVRQHRKRNRY